MVLRRVLACLALLLPIAVILWLGRADGGAGDEDERPVVLTSSGIVAEWVQEVAGERLRVRSLPPPASDPHAFRPTPKDATALRQAAAVVLVGAGFEPAIEAVLEDGPQVLRLADHLSLRTVAATTAESDAHDHHGHDHHGHDHHHDHAGDGRDPHFWHDPRLVADALPVIVDHLAAIDPDGAATYAARAEAYAATLRDLDAAIRERLAPIPEARRILITNHDAFAYFAAAYDLRTPADYLDTAAIDQGIGPRSVTALVALVRAEKVPAIFSEQGHDSSVARRVADSAGVPLIDDLLAGSLGRPGSPTGDYVGMLRHNADRVAAGLSP